MVATLFEGSRKNIGDGLESRIMADLAISDRLAIIDLVNEYAWLLDQRRWHEVAGLCTEDVVLSIRGREIHGLPGLAAWADHRAANRARRTQHQMTLHRLEPITADHVKGTAALVLHVATPGHGGTYVDLVGEYRDEYLRTGGGWRFHRRNLVNIVDA
jgi:hypothetical protein